MTNIREFLIGTGLAAAMIVGVMSMSPASASEVGPSQGMAVGGVVGTALKQAYGYDYGYTQPYYAEANGNAPANEYGYDGDR